MNYLNKIKNEIIEKINTQLGDNLVSIEDIVIPPNSEMGDLSLACFAIAKKLGKNPTEIANDLCVKLTSVVFAEIKAMGPYVNFKLSNSLLAESILNGNEEIIQKTDKKVVIEYANQNTHKELHIGHLRNFCFGDAIKRILTANGQEVIPLSYINDCGIHTAKVVWYIMKYEKGNIDNATDKSGQLARYYVESVKILKDNVEAQKEVEEVMKKIEQKEGQEFDLWARTRNWSIDQFASVYEELGLEFIDTYYESDLLDQGKAMVKDLVDRNILTKSDNAIIADLEKYKLGVLVVVRSDGTTLYPVADLPLSTLKFQKYNPDKSIYVVDIRQNLYFKQLFKILELLGYNMEMVHLGYDFVRLPDGMMSSRSGNVITYEDLRDQIMEKVKIETKDRHADWTDEKINEVARIITIGAMKFEMIKVGANTIITFDINQALRFDGFTAAYLQYTCARINSIIRKSEIDIKDVKIDNNSLNEPKEHELLMKMALFEDVVRKAGEQYDPSCLAKYLFELSQLFNDYYHQVQVLQTDEKVKISRLVLINAVRNRISKGLNLLGIATLDEM